MKAPIAQRRVTGARPLPGRRRSRGARPPLRHPLALLYRQSGKVRPAAPATLRAADGREVPLAPRLQIALNLALTLNEHHRAFMISVAPCDTAPVMLAAPPEQASATRRSNSAGHLTRVESEYRTAAGARSAPPFGHTGARGNAAHASGHDRLVHARSARNVPGDGRLLVTRFGNPPAVVRHGRTDLALRLIKSRSDVPPRARRGAGQPAADVRFRIPASLADRHGERPPPPTPAERQGATDGAALQYGAALQSSAAAPAGPPLQRPGQPSSRSISRRLPGVMAFASLQRPGRVGPPRAAGRLSTASGTPAARGIPAPLYLADRHNGRSTAPPSFGSVWAPPPLDFRSAEAPPAPAPPAEARPAATTAPSVAPVDLEAVSRDVISRIEKRLRVERERRGRS